MRRVIPGIVAAVGVLLIVGCGGRGIPRSEELVPDSANVIGRLELSEILVDADIAELYASAPKEEDQPATFQGLLDLAQDEIGIDLREFSHAVFFGNTDREEFFGIIAEGAFDRDTLLLSIVEAAKGQFSTGYKGHELRTLQDQEDGKLALVFLDDETLVFGLDEAVRQVIDVLEGDRRSIRGGVLDNYNALGNPWLKVAFEIPADALSDISELPLNFSFIADIRTIGVALDKIGDEFLAQVTADFGAEESATDMADALDGVLKLSRSLLSDESIRDLLSRVEVAASGPAVTVSLEASTTELQELDIEDIFGGAAQPRLRPQSPPTVSGSPDGPRTAVEVNAPAATAVIAPLSVRAKGALTD